MATILLSAAGAAFGGSIGGSVLGISAAALGQAAGATIGRVIDAKLLGAGSPAVETGRIDRFRLTGASEGAAISGLHGRSRISGQVIWASQFQERSATSGGGSGKGSPSAPKVTSYSYSVSVAIALCKGEITRVGRIWADGNEISKTDLNMRVYPGNESQMPDAKIEAVEGVDLAPAYRGTAYVVIEDLALEPYGNRVPQFSFEVMRATEGDVSHAVKATALIPGTGEYALATTPIHFQQAPGLAVSANVHNAQGVTDLDASLEAMTEELPNCDAVSLIVSWFGNDLRCGQCQIKPKVEKTALDGSVPWVVSGVSRAVAETVPQEDGRPVYGGTPSDRSVLEAIAALKASGQGVMLYPFVLMEQVAGNGLTDPWTGAPDQPVLPWRGRITTSLAPGQVGSPDGTSAAEDEVAAFFGNAAGGEFAIGANSVSYTGADGFTYRRFILHLAHLCALAGGVDAFCIGSELRGLTQIRGAGNSFPAVEALRVLAADVRAILGPDVKVGYAADWTEYFGYHPQDGSGDVYFHLDPLWADATIDFIGIDNYMPMSDWRDGWDHADSHRGSIYNLQYLKDNIAGGEGYDWCYPTAQAEALQLRKPITDGAYNEPWVFRYKDLKNWWSQPHHERTGGVRDDDPTLWVPESKPIWFTEIGCAAIDKGTNEPNKFLDPKSSESSLPKFSSGARDDLIQMQYLRAMIEFWSDGANNPVSQLYGDAMVATDRMYVWAWDARPYPFFPGNTDVWSDGENYARGHWLNGRSTARHLGGVLAELCAEAGVGDVDVEDVYGLVRGYVLDGTETARAAIQPLLLAFGVDAIERDGKVVFKSRTGQVDWVLSEDDLAEGEAGMLVSRMRAPEAEISGRVRLGFVEADGDYEVRGTEAIFPDEATIGVSRSEMPLALAAGEARGIVERWLAEARVARDGAAFALPPSSPVEAGDVVEIDGETYRIDRVEAAGLRQVDAVRVERGLYRGAVTEDTIARPGAVTVPLPVWSTLMNLPLISGTELADAPWIVASAGDAWPGVVAVYSSLDGQSWTYETELSQRAVMGQTVTALDAATPGLWQPGPQLEVRLTHGALGSIDEATVFAGGNVAAISNGSGFWELLQFRDAALISPDTWQLGHLLRGQQGTEVDMAPVWPVGATFVAFDAAPVQIEVPSALRGVNRMYRVGPASKPVDHASYVELNHAATAVGLRPYAPTRLTAVNDGAAGFAVSWIRRGRIDGDNWMLPDVPLGETYEAYMVRILDGDAVVREDTVSTAAYTYDTATMATDGVSAPFTVEVAQISDRYGPGAIARIVIDG